MKKSVLAAMCLTLACVGTRAAHAQTGFDRVKQHGNASTSGKIAKMSSTVVVVEQTGGVTKDVEVNTIIGVLFSGEPKELAGGREMINNGKFAEGKTLLSKIDLDKIERPEVKQDIEYYIAYATGRLALAGSGDPAKAAKQMFDWEKSILDDAKSPTNYHYFEACELLGDLATNTGKYTAAETYYAKVALAPWADFQMRAAVLSGRALQSQKSAEKQKAAIAQFDKALAMNADTPEGKRQALAATLGKALSMAEIGDEKPAVAMIEKVIADASPEEVDLHARAYNALGRCRQKMGEVKPALLAYLHVDLLYFGNPEAHAEALSQLAKLWPEAGQADRGREAKTNLTNRYPNSVWAK